MELPCQIQNKIDSLFELNEKYYDNDDYSKCIQIHENAWKEFPDPKYNYVNEGYALIQGLVFLNLKIDNLIQAEQWARQLYLFDQSDFLGTSEFALGQVLYEMERMDEAKEQFAIAMIKSEGRVFEDENPKYLSLIQND